MRSSSFVFGLNGSNEGGCSNRRQKKTQLCSSKQRLGLELRLGLKFMVPWSIAFSRSTLRVNASCPGSEPVGHGRTSLFCLSVVAQVARSRKHDLDTRPLTLHTILTQVSLKSGDPQPDRRRVFSFTLRRQTRPTGLLSKRQGRKVSCQKSYCITPVHTSTVVT